MGNEVPSVLPAWTANLDDKPELHEVLSKLRLNQQQMLNLYQHYFDIVSSKQPNHDKAREIFVLFLDIQKMQREKVTMLYEKEPDSDKKPLFRRVST